MNFSTYNYIIIKIYTIYNIEYTQIIFINEETEAQEA